MSANSAADSAGAVVGRPGFVAAGQTGSSLISPFAFLDSSTSAHPSAMLGGANIQQPNSIYGAVRRAEFSTSGAAPSSTGFASFMQQQQTAPQGMRSLQQQQRMSQQAGAHPQLQQRQHAQPTGESQQFMGITPNTWLHRDLVMINNMSAAPISDDQRRGGTGVATASSVAIPRPVPGAWNGIQSNAVDSSGGQRPFQESCQSTENSFMWSSTPSIRADMGPVPITSVPGYSLQNDSTRFVSGMGQYRANSFPTAHLVKNRLSQIPTGQTGNLVLPSRAIRHPLGGRSFFGGPRQFTSSRGKEDVPAGENAAMAQYLRNARDFPTVHKSNKNSAGRESPSNFPFFAVLLTTALATDIAESLEDRLSSSTQKASTVTGIGSVTTKTSTSSCTSITSRAAFTAVVAPGAPSSNFAIDLHPVPPNCDPSISPGGSSKSPVTASSVEDDCGGGADIIRENSATPTNDGQSSTTEHNDPLDEIDSEMTTTTISSQKPSFQTETFHLQAFNEEMMTSYQSPPVTMLPLLAAVLQFCEGGCLAKCEMLNVGFRGLIRDRLPQLWKSAVLCEEEDIELVEPDILGIVDGERILPLAMFYKLRWLLRQGALQYCAYKERLEEYTERHSLDLEIEQLQTTSAAGAANMTLRSKQQLLSQARKMSQIQSELKSHARGVQKVLRSIKALQVTVAQGSKEYEFIAGLLRLPWALADISVKTKSGPVQNGPHNQCRFIFNK